MLLIKKNVLVTTTIVTIIFLSICCRSISGSAHKLKSFTNKEIIIKNLIPDVSTLLLPAATATATAASVTQANDDDDKSINNNNNNKNNNNIKTNKNDQNLNSLLSIWSTTFSDKNGQQFEVTNDVPFTIIVPKIDDFTIKTERLKEFLLEHLIPGVMFTTFNDENNNNNNDDDDDDNDEDDDDDDNDNDKNFYGNSNKHEIIIKKIKIGKQNESQWTLNDNRIVRTAVLINDKLSAIYIDGVLDAHDFDRNNDGDSHDGDDDDDDDDRKTAFSKRNIQEANRYNEPQRLEMKNISTKDETQALRKDNMRPSPLMTFLTGQKSGTKVFQHFLSKSNLTQILDDSPYTILIPSDNAFQRWHPIDWGFYPFSVQEFTENILRNHFLQMKTPIRMEDVMGMDRGHKYKTLGGEVVIFKNNPTPSVNNVSILTDYTLPNGNEVFLISEVLFVSEAVVSRLHQMHKDKETPPLLAFPWFGAQFLSHSFLALERDNRFTQMTRFLNTADIAQYVSGANYTFFVPMDSAFEKHGFTQLSDETLASEKGIRMLLNHFVKGRLYDKDLRHDEVFESLGGGAVRIQRPLSGKVTVNRANIIESEVFVYNLGTMFYIDDILYSDILTTTEIMTSSTKFPSSSSNNNNKNYKYSTLPDVESVPNEFTDQISTAHDDDDDDEIVTPRALPVQLKYSPK